MRHRLSIFPPWTMSFLGEVCMSLAELVTPQDGEQCRRIISGAFQLATIPLPTTQPHGGREPVLHELP